MGFESQVAIVSGARWEKGSEEMGVGRKGRERRFGVGSCSFLILKFLRLVARVPYLGTVSHKIQRLLKKQANIDVVFKRSHTIQNTIKATGKPPSSHKPEPSGAVYHIPCNCGQAYIGETSRLFKTRIKEHQSSVSKDDSKSALSDHIRDNPSHSIQWERVTTLATNLKDLKIRKLQEAINIKRLQPSINRDQGYYIPLAYHQLIKDPKDPKDPNQP
ncbi:uncharacterized protein [Haliotis cracherodii]|uniref:uncharacterized protein n=1 Tax=Haliotis cracherodii TaxID=6455 RepID=UPI0039EB94B4